jgi:hypothetical protein
MNVHEQVLSRDREKLGLDWIASASVSMEGCQRDSVSVEHTRPKSTSPPSRPPVFPGLHISLWSKIEKRVGVWFAEVCADRNQNENLIRRSKEAILHRMKNLLAKTIRESLGAK